ncbi:hypothetical protein P8452_69595 [Trifolium repens]|nr:hypothetical protein P8452_69595 [Trifolium repens]
MVNFHGIFPITILIIGVLLFTNNAKTIAVRYVSFTTPPTNDHPPGCGKDQQNNLSPSLLYSFHQMSRESSEDLNPRHHSSVQRYIVSDIARLVPGGPNKLHNF